VPIPIGRDRVQALAAQGAQLLEVLPAAEYAQEHLVGARSLPLRSLSAETAATLDRSRPLIVYCSDSL
jgi:rhodanese-related sulfurtransferase